jgi:drug/metabolite transporter (DMT)-like permease
MPALGIALYNVIDAQGTRAAETPYVFIAWLFLIDVIGITSVTLMMRGPKMLAAALTVRWRYGLVAGGLSIASYGAALYGFSISNVAMISALRETSVVFAVLMGAKWLKEGVSPRRIAAAVALVAGLVLMQVAG